MEKQNKKLYTQGGFLGYITKYYKNIVYIQPLDGSPIIRGVGKNLTKNCLEGIVDVAFEYFINNGRFAVQAFPVYRAGNPIIGSATLNGIDKEKLELNPSFEGTWSEFLDLSKRCRALAKTAIPVQPSKEAILMLPMVIFTPEALAISEETVETLEPELAEVTDDCYIEQSSEECYEDGDEDDYYDDVPDEKFDWDSEEAEEFEKYYDVDDSPKTSKIQWH